MHLGVSRHYMGSLSLGLISKSSIYADIDECTEGTDGCSQICTNTIGTYSCSCNSGYSLASNGHSCNDINECALGTDGCAQACTNTIGNYTCSCNSGYHLTNNGHTCSGKLITY